MQFFSKYKRIILFAVKVLVVVIAWWYIYEKIIKSAHDFYRISFTPEIITAIVLACAIMPLNWMLEAKKWHVLITPILKISYAKALQGTLIGITFGFVTPNRIGDIGGRSIVLPSHQKHGVIASSIGSMLQLFVTIIMGVLGIIALFLFVPHPETIQTLMYISFIIALIVCISVIILFRKKIVQKIVLRIIGVSKYKKVAHTFSLYSSKTIYKACTLAILRYVVFSSQYYILLHAFFPQLSFIQNVVGITLSYLFATLIPSSILGELGVRGSVSVFIFGLFSAAALHVFQVSLLIWLINLAVPVVIGSFLLVVFRSQKKANTQIVP
ncbi:MAG: flippase-like domain-containing protein [Bacteroidales bacterium]|nr:flippase-like domain-containing protein [Bacteroidales bacterium]